MTTARSRFWSGTGAARFRDVELGPLTRRLVTLAAPRRGEHAIDVGCGAGATCALLAARVGPRGSVLGIDISAPLLALARERAPAAELVHADAQTYPFAPGHAQLVFSRFGMAFFADPLVAFRGLRRALAPRGRLVFSCHGPPADTGWLQLVVAAAAEALPGWRPPRLDGAGPFALADRRRLAALLARAGFTRVKLEPYRGTELHGATVAAATADVIARPFVDHVLAGIPAAARARIAAGVRRALAALPRAKGGREHGTPVVHWIVTARAPARRRPRIIRR